MSSRIERGRDGALAGAIQLSAWRHGVKVRSMAELDTRGGILSFGFFAVLAVVLLITVPRMWRLDVEQLNARYRNSPLAIRRSLAASPAALVWSWVTTVLGVLIALDVDVASAYGYALVVIWAGAGAAVIGTAYFGRPRFALLPALQSAGDYRHSWPRLESSLGRASTPVVRCHLSYSRQVTRT